MTEHSEHLQALDEMIADYEALRQARVAKCGRAAGAPRSGGDPSWDGSPEAADLESLKQARAEYLAFYGDGARGDQA